MKNFRLHESDEVCFFEGCEEFASTGLKFGDKRIGLCVSCFKRTLNYFRYQTLTGIEEKSFSSNQPKKEFDPLFSW